MKTLCGVVLAAFVLVCAGAQKAWAEYYLWEAPNEIGMLALINVVGMHDMEGGRWVVQAAPGYFDLTSTYKQIHQTSSGCTGGSCGSALSDAPIHGYSGAVAIKREFTPHWGLGLLGVVAAQTGQFDVGSLGDGVSGLAPPAAKASTPGNAGFAGGHWSGIHTNSVELAATWDPFSDPKGFRMPISFGPAVIMQGWQFHHAYTNPNNGAAQSEDVDFSRTILGVFANASFDIPATKYFRVMPGFIFQTGIDNWTGHYDYVVTQNGSSKTYPGDITYGNLAGAPYLSVMYRPWDLSFTYPIDLAGGSYSNFSVTMTKKFGGHANTPL